MNDIILKEQRLLILQRLKKSANYTTNEFMLQADLISNGLSASVDDVKNLLLWLQDKNLVIVNPLIVELTQKGLDIAAGHTTCDVVAKIKPKE